MRDCSTPSFAVISIGERSSVANVPWFKTRWCARLPLSFPPPFPRKEDAHCSPPARPCYLFTNSERARAREENGRPVCDTVFVLRFMVKPARIYANVMPRPEGQVKKMARHRGRNHVETHYASVWAWRSATRIHLPSPLPPKSVVI